MNFRDVYLPLITATETAGYFVTEMPLDSGGDRIVCCGQRRDGGGYTGNSFWFAEREGRWFLGTWGGTLFQVADVNTACSIAITWLSQNHTKTAASVPEAIKTQFALKIADYSEFDQSENA